MTVVGVTMVRSTSVDDSCRRWGKVSTDDEEAAQGLGVPRAGQHVAVGEDGELVIEGEVRAQRVGVHGVAVYTLRLKANF